MKKSLFISVLVLSAAVAISQTLYQLSTGFGAKLTATTAATSVVISEVGVDNVYATSISVYNEGTSTVFCAVDCDPITFAKKLANETTVQIPKALTYTFKGEKLRNVCVATTNGTATVYVGAHADK
ncbi:MAG TPA: hypothetical protein PKW18_12955 [Candidatus Sumerlaeota bacterium]|nr:hypothetical protein [Candidatus Sumerlaeota bacterium]